MMDFSEASRQNHSLMYYNQTQQLFVPQVQIPTLVISTFILVIAIVVGFYGNGMTLVASAKSKNCKHNNKNNFDTLIVDMAAADFIICCVFSPIVLHLGYFQPENTRAFCAATLYLGVTCSIVSICTVDVIAIHRQCRVIKNYKGTTGFSSCQAYFIITTLWLFGFSLSTGGYIHTETANQTYTKCSSYLNSDNPETHNFVLFFITPVCLVSFAIVIISYSIIAYAVLKQTKIKSSSTMSSPTRNVAPLNENLKGEIEATVQAKVQVQALSLDKESKALTMCLAVTITLIVCWSPLVTAQIVEFSLGESMAVYQVKIIGITLVCLNSAINPYMYAKNSGHLKEASKKVYHMILKCNCCFSTQPVRTKLKPMGRGNLETNWNKSSHYETDSAHNGLAGPGKVDRAVGPSKSMGHITFTPNTQTVPTDNYVYTISLHKGPHFLASCTGRSAIHTSSNGYDLQESFDTMTENETQVVPMPQNS